MEKEADALEHATPVRTIRPGGLSPSPGPPGLLGRRQAGWKESPKYRDLGEGGGCALSLGLGSQKKPQLAAEERRLDWRRQERSWAEKQESIRKTISDCRIEVFTQQTN